MVDKITVSLPDDVSERLHDHLDYGDNRSAWVAKAIEQRLDRIEAGEEREEDTDQGNPRAAATIRS